MTVDAVLRQVAEILANRTQTYGAPDKAMAAIAVRWSITLGHPVTPAEVVLCMIDLKLTRLVRDPRHQDSILDIAGYAAVLSEVSR